jgi:hypothetical protein
LIEIRAGASKEPARKIAEGRRATMSGATAGRTHFEEGA